MASCRKKTRKDGTEYYEIRIRPGRNQPEVTTRWDVPKGWSQTAIERELKKVSSDFERKVKAGEVKSLHEKKKADEREKAEAKKIKTVSQYINGVFLPGKEVAGSKNTQYNYKLYCDKYIIPVIGNMLIVEVTPAIISKLLLDFQKKGYKHGSCIKLYNLLNGIFKTAFLDDTITVNPMLKVQRPVPRKGEKLQEEADKAYTVEEVQQVINCSWQEYQAALREEQEAVAKNKSIEIIAYKKTQTLAAFRWYVYLMLLIDTGARRGELFGLQWKDINWANPGITIKRNIQYDPSHGVYETTPKNGKIRTVDIGDETLFLLKELRAEQAASCISKWVFTAEGKSEALSPQVATTYFRRFGERHGLKNFHPHMLRHSSASMLITHGADIASVSARLGHSDTAVTLRMYTHAEESIRRAGQIGRDLLKAPQVKQA